MCRPLTPDHHLSHLSPAQSWARPTSWPHSKYVCVQHCPSTCVSVCVCVENIDLTSVTSAQSSSWLTHLFGNFQSFTIDPLESTGSGAAMDKWPPPPLSPSSSLPPPWQTLAYNTHFLPPTPPPPPPRSVNILQTHKLHRWNNIFPADGDWPTQAARKTKSRVYEWTGRDFVIWVGAPVFFCFFLRGPIEGTCLLTCEGSTDSCKTPTVCSYIALSSIIQHPAFCWLNLYMNVC